MNFLTDQQKKEFFAAFGEIYLTESEKAAIEREKQEKARLKEEEARRALERKSDKIYTVAGPAGEYSRRKRAYQDETHFVRHDGLITLQEVCKYEGDPFEEEVATKQFKKEYRERVIDMMMVDHEFANIMTHGSKKVSKKYKELEKEARKQKKNLKWTANVSGFSKVTHCVTKTEKRQAQERLEQLKRAKAASYRAEYDKDAYREKWNEEVVKYYRPMDYSDPYEDIFLDVRSGIAMDYTPAKCYDPEVASRMNYYGKKFIKNVTDEVISQGAALCATDGDLCWEYAARDTEKILIATGKGGLTPTKESQKKAFNEVTERIEAWSDMVSGMEVFRQMDVTHCDPKYYLSPHTRERVLKYKNMSWHLSYLGDTLRDSQVYREMSKTERMNFEKIMLTIETYRGWFGAVVKNMKAWDEYYRAGNEQKAAMAPEKRPQPVPRTVHFAPK
ncbi:MAG: hypothetical protein K6A69_00100 [Lachnospiraceae bacterium]|nr:hypothetical protein [Lachnospiraceae bacterium]